MSDYEIGIHLLSIPAMGSADLQEAFSVSRIIDGDTIELAVNGELVKVRLIGVDTPETVHPSKPVEHFGREATAFTKQLTNHVPDAWEKPKPRSKNILALICPTYSPMYPAPVSISPSTPYKIHKT
jgi:endonuclease YncB( thermonuclease family)